MRLIFFSKTPSRQIVISLVILLIASACAKKIDTELVEDFSLPSNLHLNSIEEFHQQLFVAGGDQFTQSAIFRFQNNQLQAIQLPANASQTEIYGLAHNDANRIVAVTYGSGIYYSEDTGFHWQFVQTNLWRELRGVAFTSVDSIYVVGKGSTKYGLIAQGTAQGAGFNHPHAEYNFELNALTRTPNGKLYASGYGAILHSVDSGHTWSFTDAKNDWYKSMCWLNNNTGYAAGYEGSLIKTSDAGSHWRFLRNGNNSFLKRYHFFDIQCKNETVVAVGEEGLIYVSQDGGEHWKTIKKFTNKHFRAVYLLTEKQFYVSGESGAFYRVTLTDE